MSAFPLPYDAPRSQPATGEPERSGHLARRPGRRLLGKRAKPSRRAAGKLSRYPLRSDDVAHRTAKLQAPERLSLARASRPPPIETRMIRGRGKASSRSPSQKGLPRRVKASEGKSELERGAQKAVTGAPAAAAYAARREARE